MGRLCAVKKQMCLHLGLLRFESDVLYESNAEFFCFFLYDYEILAKFPFFYNLNADKKVGKVKLKEIKIKILV